MRISHLVHATRLLIRYFAQPILATFSRTGVSPYSVFQRWNTSKEIPAICWKMSTHLVSSSARKRKQRATANDQDLHGRIKQLVQLQNALNNDIRSFEIEALMEQAHTALQKADLRLRTIQGAKANPVSRRSSPLQSTRLPLKPSNCHQFQKPLLVLWKTMRISSSTTTVPKKMIEIYRTFA